MLCAVSCDLIVRPGQVRLSVPRNQRMQGLLLSRASCAVGIRAYVVLA